MNTKSNGLFGVAIFKRGVRQLVPALLFCTLLQTVDAQIFINFDTDASGNPITAPSIFAEASPLTTLYAPLGVTFSGPGPGLGGAILNETGSFGIAALSGNNFLAFNGSTYATLPETITFNTPMSSVSIFGGTGYGEQFTMQAYGTGGTLLDSDTVNVTAGNYEPLDVASSEGITSVVLTGDNGGPSWVYDNLSATPVPEPSYLAFPAVGFTALLLYRLQRRKLSGIREPRTPHPNANLRAS